MPDKNTLPHLFSQVDVTTGSQRPTHVTPGDEQTAVLKDVLSAQDRTNELLEELVGAMSAQQRARRDEMERWRDANPNLAESCREAAETLSVVQTDYLERLTEDVRDNGEDMGFGDYMLTEFVDRYGPRLAHLNGVIQALAQLGGAAPVEADEE